MTAQEARKITGSKRQIKELPKNLVGQILSSANKGLDYLNLYPEELTYRTSSLEETLAALKENGFTTKYIKGLDFYQITW